jgi:hypothetical protein
MYSDLQSVHVSYCTSVLAILEWCQGSRAVPSDGGCRVAEWARGMQSLPLQLCTTPWATLVLKVCVTSDTAGPHVQMSGKGISRSRSFRILSVNVLVCQKMELHVPLLTTNHMLEHDDRVGSHVLGARFWLMIGLPGWVGEGTWHELTTCSWKTPDRGYCSEWFPNPDVTGLFSLIGEELNLL